MRSLKIWIFVLFLLIILSCGKNTDNPLPNDNAFRFTKKVSYNGVSVNVVIEKPETKAVDVLMVFHGTVHFDSKIPEAANHTLNIFKQILQRTDMMLLSVAYPEENLLLGDNIAHCEAALLWLKHSAEDELDISVKKIFLAGHSQGGYLVTRLNTMHPTNGVIANAPGPLNLVYRCQLEENGNIPNGMVCTLLRNSYGDTETNPDAYYQRSLLNFTGDFRSDILFVQGMDDSPIQMHSWPVFKEYLEDCTNCQGIEFLEIAGYGHQALFYSPQAKNAFNQFISNR
jgi:hypothetical protein